MRYTLLFIFLMSILFSCQQDISNPDISDRVIFKESPLDSVYSTLRPEIQTFEIDINQPNQIVAKKGTEIFIPENAFVDEFGKPVLGNVEVSVTEVFELEDFITSGLATMSNGRLLISNGMMNIDATSNGKRIGLKEGKEIAITMPTKTDNSNFQMFVGDGQNWEIDNSKIEQDYLIPVPLDLLYSDGNPLFYLLEDPDYLLSLLDSSGISIKDKKFENTIIATEAFHNRFIPLHYMAEILDFRENRKTYLGNYHSLKFNYDLLKIYFYNPTEPIEKLDELAKQKYVQFYNDNEEDLNIFFEEYNQYAIEHLADWGGRPTLNKEWFMLFLDGIPKGDKGKVKIIDDHGVDLDSENAFQELKEKGVAAKEIDEILSYHFKRKNLIEKLEKRIKTRKDTQMLNVLVESTIFSVKKLGWINCDRFYNDPNAKESNIIVSNSSDVQLEYADFSLVIPNLNARLRGYINEDKNYLFTQKGGIYTKLPIGEKAIIVGISMQDDSIFYAKKEIEIQEELTVNVEMKAITKEALKKSLSTLF